MNIAEKNRALLAFDLCREIRADLASDVNAVDYARALSSDMWAEYRSRVRGDRKVPSPDTQDLTIALLKHTERVGAFA